MFCVFNIIYNLSSGEHSDNEDDDYYHDSNDYDDNNDDKNNSNDIERHNSRLCTVSSLHRKRSPTHTLKWPARIHVQITCNTWSAYHVQHDVSHVV